MPYNGEDNNDYVDGKGFCCNDGSLEAAQTRALARAAKNNFQEGDTYEKMQFYYHPDHLGSSSYITNLEGEVVQHIVYVPFGEVFVESATTFGIHLTFSMRRNSTRRRDCITMGQGSMTQG